MHQEEKSTFRLFQCSLHLTTLNHSNQILIDRINNKFSWILDRVELLSKKSDTQHMNNTAFQLSRLIEFRTETISRYFLVGEDQPKTTPLLFQNSLNQCLSKKLKFQKNLLSSIEEFLQIIQKMSHKILILSKNLVVNILNHVKNGSNNSKHKNISDIIEKLQGLERQTLNQKQIPQQLTHIIQEITNVFNIQFQKVNSTLRSSKMYQNFHRESKTDEEKMIEINRILHSQSKLILADYIEEKYNQEQTVIHTCLSCETKVSFDAMEAHLELCQSKTYLQQKIVNLDAQIIAKVYDLMPQLTNAKNVLRQKFKELNEKIKQELALKNGKFKKSKGFYAAPLLSKTFGANMESDSDDSNSLDSPKKSVKTVKDLTIKELSTYITIIEQLYSIGNKIKNQRSAANLVLSNQIYNINNVVIHKFNRLKIQCCLVNSLLNLLASRRECMRKLSKSMSQAKSTGLKFVQDAMFQNQYEDIADSTRKSKKKKRHIDPYALYFSEQETPSVSNDTQNNKVCLNDFLVLGFLGKGQFGEILLVKKKQTGAKYAMKKVLIKEMKKYTQNVQNQLMALSVVNSEFVVKTIFSFSQNDFHYFVMEYMPNGDFFQLLQYQNRLYQSEAKLYLAQIATAINDLHKEGIIHRDIKPQNILISQTGHIKISDFGLSESGSLKKFKQQEKKRRMTRFQKEQLINKQEASQKKINKIVGSPYFMSPEVLSGETASVMSDWWSFGVLVFEVLTGIPPFVGQSFDQIVSKIFQGNIWSQSIKFGKQEDEISYQAKDLIQKLLMRNQDKRLGINFQDIKRHPFFQGVVWDKLIQLKPYFEFDNEQQDFGEGKQISSKTSSFRSTNPDLKLIRKDILIEQTRAIYSNKSKRTIRMKNFIKALRKSTI